MRDILPPYSVSRFIAIMCARRRPARDEAFAGLAFVTSALAIAGASAAAAVVCVFFVIFAFDSNVTCSVLPGVHWHSETASHGLAHFRAKVRLLRRARRDCCGWLADVDCKSAHQQRRQRRCTLFARSQEGLMRDFLFNVAATSTTISRELRRREGCASAGRTGKPPPARLWCSR